MRAIIFTATIASCGAAGLPMHALAAEARYSITDLGIVNESVASVAINNSGLVALTTNFTDDVHPNSVFLIDQGQTTQLSTLGGRWTFIAEINEHGLLAGSSETSTGSLHGVMYEDANIRDIGTIVPGGLTLSAINDSGIAVGGTLQLSNNRAVMVTGPNDFTILGTLGGNYSSASDINNLGQITGISFTGKEFLPMPTVPFDEAFLYENGQMIGIGGLGGQVSYGYAINDLGQIVGYSNLANGEQHAFVWDKASGMKDLGTPGLQSNATDINKHGIIVGVVEVTPGNRRAAIFHEVAGYRLLQDLIPAHNGWEALSYATDINDLGQIVGTGVFHGQNRAFLLKPIPEPSSCALFAIATLIVTCWRRGELSW